MNTDTHTIEDAVAVKETPKALQVRVDDKFFWVPKSVIHDDSEVYAEKHAGDLIVERWWAEKEGLE